MKGKGMNKFPSKSLFTGPQVVSCVPVCVSIALDTIHTLPFVVCVLHLIISIPSPLSFSVSKGDLLFLSDVGCWWFIPITLNIHIYNLTTTNGTSTPTDVVD